MASLLDRVGTLISANVNWLVSSALKANSMAVVDEYIRKVEDNLEALEDAAATVGGEAKTLRRKYTDYQAQVDEMDKNINVMLQEGKEDLAVAGQSRLNTLERLTATYKEQAEHQETEFQTLMSSKLRLEAKLTGVKQERVELQARLDLAKSKELTHKVVEGVGGVTVSDAGITDIRDEIDRRLDKATAQGEIDASRLENQMSEVLEERTIKSQLAERKKKLGLQ